MNKIAVCCAAAMLTACASTPTVDSIVSEGGEIVPGGIGSMIGDDGVTLTAVDNTWVSYLAPDGKKEIFIKPLNVRETLSWRLKDDGTFCEEMYKPRREKCDDEEDQVLVKRANGNYSIFTNGEMGKYPFKVTNGNPNNY